jgi:choline dehydrogenase
MARAAIPGCNEHSPGASVTGEKLLQWIRNEAWGHHAGGTCAIGAQHDPQAVLDKDFRVRGTSNLRVVDASIFPRIPGFFPVVPICMAAEKAATVIHRAASKAPLAPAPLPTSNI